MTIPVHGYAALTATDALVPFRFERRDPRPNDVVIAIQFCGVCHSDIHSVRNDWGGAVHPMVPGHEIVGRVVGVGAAVTKFREGDRVGVGCMVDSCQQCATCKRDLEQYCENGATFTYNDKDRHDQRPTYGGYSQAIVVSDRFVVSIPDALDLASAAPLLCAGITTWSPLRHWKVGPGTRLAVIGLGGLGHMALKLGKALGAEVTLFTRSPGKEADARRLGADHVVLSTDKAQMKAVARRFDLVIDTVPNDHELDPYVPVLAIDGTIVLVGYLGPTKVKSTPLILGRRAVAGSVIGGIAETQEMLNFCGEHRITADIETIAIADIDRAYERMMNSDVKYRFVIDLATLPA